MNLSIRENLQLVRMHTINREQVEAIHPMLSKASVTQYLPIDAVTSMDETEAFLNQFIVEGSHLWFIQSGEDVVGFIDIISNSDGSYNLAYVLDDEHWGKGITTQAISAVVEYATSELAAHTIKAPVVPENIASQKVLLKNGFKKSDQASSKKDVLMFVYEKTT